MNRLTVLAACCLALSLTNCKKNDNNASISSNTTELNRLYSALRSTPQSFTVTAGSTTKIYGDKSTIITFYPNSFKDKSGAVISSGTINIDLVEMYSVGDMIANRATTAMSNGLLTSSGQVNIKATMSGQEVYANKYGVKFNATTYKPMELYYGSNSSETEVSWTMADTMKAGTKTKEVVYITDRARNWQERPYFAFDSCFNFDFVNCDHPYDSTCRNATITVTMSDNRFTPANTALWVCYPAKKVVTCLHPYSSPAGSITFSGYVPIGPACKFVVMANNVVNSVDNYYYYDQTGVIYGNTSITAAMASKTANDIKAKLSEL